MKDRNMKPNAKKFFAFVLLVLIVGIPGYGEDLRKIVSLSGYWKFSIGDDLQWASPSYDDSQWDQLTVPGQWENQGYNDYNGYAWYRKKFRLQSLPSNTTLYLILGRIDDADMVYINGKALGNYGQFPPNFKTAYDRTRKYVIPPGYLKENAENVVAVKVYDTFLAGGITDGTVGMYVDSDNDFLDLNFSGRWKFHTGDSKEWKAPDFNDAAWKTIHVPSEWGSAGLDNYDGYGWYRYEFRLPQNFSGGELFLSLGKIDDVDEVYLNGKYVGSVYDLRKDAEYKRSGWEYNARRIYKIKEGMLNRNGINKIAIRVYDGQQRGGIYEGPVGIMSAENYRRYRNKHFSNQSFWDYWYDIFFDE
jgi:hypothetical protein